MADHRVTRSKRVADDAEQLLAQLLQLDGLLRSLVRRITSCAPRSTRGFVCTPRDLCALFAVHWLGRPAISAIANVIGLSCARTSEVIDRLTTAGYMNRRREAVDRRHVRAWLTSRGRRLLESLAQTFDGQLRLLHGAASVRDVRRLVVALRNSNRVLDAT